MKVSMTRTKGEAWLLAVKIGVGMNSVLMVAFLLLAVTKASGGGGCGYIEKMIPCIASLVFCLAYIAFSMCRQLATTQVEGAESSPRHRPVAPVAAMVILAASSCATACAIRSPTTMANRVLFSVGSLCKSQAALLNLATSVARIVGFSLYVPEDELEDLFIEELCVGLMAMFAAFAAEEACKSMRPLTTEIEDLESGGRAKYVEGVEHASENMALQSILKASCDAVVFVDTALKITRPSPGLAAMLGFEAGSKAASTSMQGIRLPIVAVQSPGSQEEDTEYQHFMRALRSERRNPMQAEAVAAQLPITLTTARGDMVRVHCAFTSILSSENNTAGYLLGISERSPFEDKKSKEYSESSRQNNTQRDHPSNMSGHSVRSTMHASAASIENGNKSWRPYMSELQRSQPRADVTTLSLRAAPRADHRWTSAVTTAPSNSLTPRARTADVLPSLDPIGGRRTARKPSVQRMTRTMDVLPSVRWGSQGRGDGGRVGGSLAQVRSHTFQSSMAKTGSTRTARSFSSVAGSAGNRSPRVIGRHSQIFPQHPITIDQVMQDAVANLDKD